MNMKPIDAGLMDREITFIYNAGTQSPSGVRKQNWQNIATNPTAVAFMQVLDVREKARIGQAFDQDIRVFQTWWRDDITAKMSLRFDGQLYEITGKEPVGRNHQMALYARAVT